MNALIKYGSVQANPLYNCSSRTPQEWTTREGVPRHAYGATECYKIMIFLSLVDIISILVGGIITGWLGYQGAVFCTYPELIYYCGMIAESMWCCSCLTALILVTNRLFDLQLPRISKFLFDGNRTFFVIFLSVLYASYFMFFCTPVLYTSNFHTFILDPMIFEGKGLEYSNVSLMYNNFLVLFSTCFLYIVFCFVLGSKLKNVSSGSEARNASIQIFFQSAMICGVNLMASMVYVSMSFVKTPFWLIVVGHICWQLGHAAPAFVYLTFNKTIKNGVLRKFGIKKGRITNSTKKITKSSVHFSSTHTVITA
ncbi:hypothetical protein CRE_08789 [Caenorhabditis remanei]|uniref:Uncharacterized protein n=1 Tax=Caenorhabditis remanei TaxID=31234 RepID=E3LHI5_CAERE|nr:hypothetical protein CRE_08789 [Caenorhabditis remanei]